MERLIFLPWKGNKVSSLVIFVLVLLQSTGFAQSEAPRLYARLTMLKATEGKEREFENFVRESIKPLQELRRQNGELVLWIFFKVHFAGQADPYNYVGVGYYPTWGKTDQEPLVDLLRQSNPNADVAEFTRKQRELRSVVGESIFYQLETIEPTTPAPSRYVRIDYMKSRPGKQVDYLKTERNDWMPLHQRLIAEAQSSGWGLWQVVFPGGTASPYDYVTSNRYTTYDQVVGADYEAMFKKLSPAKNVNDIFSRTTQSRDLVKSELWEVVEILN